MSSKPLYGSNRRGKLLWFQTLGALYGVWVIISDARGHRKPGIVASQWYPLSEMQAWCNMLGSIRGDPGTASVVEEEEEGALQQDPDARATSAPLSLGTEWGLFPAMITVGHRMEKKKKNSSPKYLYFG